ncbi:conserved hypothetical protein [Aidingimonas halophila]|uniref:Lysylphosphatidylglycerol synthase TM region n=1 Tax=Aidingimonas halophila TaxID=574349 RepID=A0A1H3EB59_9GAMM|nr:hypothetical protein GCM10008094_28300 [Aidingimonas halophila]SDX75840.1 conserved hypothetical protein [Aidingimonas halophila]
MAWQRLLRIVLSLVVLIGLAWWLDLAAIAAEVQRLDPLWLLLGLMLSVPQMWLSAWRWRLTARALGLRLVWRRALGDYYLATFLNQVLPGAVLGDAARAWRHARASGMAGGAWRAVIIERLSGQLVMLLALVLALALSPLWHEALGRVTGSLSMSIEWLVAGSVIIGGTVAFHRHHVRCPAAIRTLVHDCRRALLVDRIWRRQLPASVLVIATYALIFVCAARAIGNDLPTTSLLALVPPVLLAMLIPLSVAGWGWREGAAALVWSSVGLPAAQGVAISLSYGVLVWLASLPGMLCLISRRRTSSAMQRRPERDVEESVVTAVETSQRRAAGLVQRIDGGETQSCLAGTDQQRRDQQVKAVECIGIDEARDRLGAALDQHARVSPFHQSRKQRRWHDITGRVGNHQPFDMVADAGGGLRPGADCMQGGGAVILEHARGGWCPGIGVEHDTDGMAPFDMSYRQQRVVGHDGADANDHGVDQCPQTVEMRASFQAVDVMRMAGDGSDSTIETLPELGDSDIPRRYHHREQAVEQLPGRRIDMAGELPSLSIDSQGVARGLPAQGRSATDISITDTLQAGPGEAVVERGQGHGISKSSSPANHGIPHRRRRWADSEE